MINIVDLPPELLVQVFSHYGAHGRSRGQPKASLDTLRRVSCLWNTLVVASPILWTDIMVPEKAVHPCAIMSLSVKRSKDMPFSITVDAAGPLVDSAMPMINILCILNAQRLKALSLSVNGSTQASSLIRSLLTVEHFPVLQQISIVQPSQGPLLANPFFDPGIPLFKGAAPVLRTMMLSNMDKIPFPLQNISQLELRQCQPATLDVLRECPRLTRLGLFALTPLTGPSVTSNPIILSSLTSLSVEPPRRRNNIDLSNLHYLIQRLSFPALEDLELIGLRSPVPCLSNLQGFK
ncbi:hypothetical protein DL96DRAFT_1557817 [Flagelloscypha sp. PMI_526]|nr:hypothetical protein DL96DRAFT_1557817 [Flagelloscypha sp. PMI_526]